MSQPSAGEYTRPVNSCKKCGHSRDFHEPDFESKRISPCRVPMGGKTCDCDGFESK